VRIVFSCTAVAASEEGEDDAPFNPPTMHEGADLAACCATIVGRLQNGTVTLQVGGIGFHAVGPLSPGCLRLALLYNVVLEQEINPAKALCQLPPCSKVNARPAVRLPKTVHEEFVAQARDLVPDPISGSIFSKVTRNDISRGSGNAKDP
jgi:hypothetical protein